MSGRGSERAASDVSREDPSTQSRDQQANRELGRAREVGLVGQKGNCGVPGTVIRPDRGRISIDRGVVRDWVVEG